MNNVCLGRYRKLCAAFCFSLVGVCGVTSTAIAEARNILVSVREVRAQGSLKQTPRAQAAAPIEQARVKSVALAVPERESDGIRIDGRIKDVAAKLRKLPFRSYSLISTERRVVPVRKRATFNLASGQTLTVRPVDCDKGKVSLWLKWLDQSGAEILDTRMRFESDEGMVAGTDLAPGSGLLLVLDVKQQ